MLIKDPSIFPARDNNIFLAHCAVSPLFFSASESIIRFTEDMARGGITRMVNYQDTMPRFHKAWAEFLHTDSKNISYIPNTATALSMLAEGYPFEPGDQVISYCHEYPSNHYPWRLREEEGVELIQLGDHSPTADMADITLPKSWSFEELTELCTERTRIITLSHVQFSSGYAADLPKLGMFCKERDIDLIIDAAQSLGCLPVYPVEWNIAAMAASCWKWLMGVKGSGVLYSSPDLRKKLKITMAGPGLMRHSLEYLNHSWDPLDDGRMFEYSTLPWGLVRALAIIAEELFCSLNMEEVREEVFRLQDLLVEHLDPDLFRFLHFIPANRSGILAALPERGDLQTLIRKAGESGVVVSGPVGYLRLAPHFYLEDEQIVQAAEVLNRVAWDQ